MHKQKCPRQGQNNQKHKTEVQIWSQPRRQTRKTLRINSHEAPKVQPGRVQKVKESKGHQEQAR